MFWGYVPNIIFILAQGTEKNHEACVRAEHVEMQKRVFPGTFLIYEDYYWISHLDKRAFF
jgi:hypothetical protein